MKAPCFDGEKKVSNDEERDEERGRVETYAISREIDDSLLRDLPNSLVDSLEFIGNTRNVLD